MRSVEHGADGANGCVPLAAVASERDSHIGFVLRPESGHVPMVSQAQKMRRERGTYRESGRGCLEGDMCIIRSVNRESVPSTAALISYRYSGAGSEDESHGIIRIGNEQLRYSSHQGVRLSRRAQKYWMSKILPLLQFQPEERGDEGVPRRSTGRMPRRKKIGRGGRAQETASRLGGVESGGRGPLLQLAARGGGEALLFSGFTFIYRVLPMFHCLPELDPTPNKALSSPPGLFCVDPRDLLTALRSPPGSPFDSRGTLLPALCPSSQKQTERALPLVSCVRAPAPTCVATLPISIFARMPTHILPGFVDTKIHSYSLTHLHHRHYRSTLTPPLSFRSLSSVSRFVLLQQLACLPKNIRLHCALSGPTDAPKSFELLQDIKALNYYLGRQSQPPSSSDAFRQPTAAAATNLSAPALAHPKRPAGGVAALALMCMDEEEILAMSAPVPPPKTPRNGSHLPSRASPVPRETPAGEEGGDGGETKNRTLPRHVCSIIHGTIHVALRGHAYRLLRPSRRRRFARTTHTRLPIAARARTHVHERHTRHRARRRASALAAQAMLVREERERDRGRDRVRREGDVGVAGDAYTLVGRERSTRHPWVGILKGAPYEDGWCTSVPITGRARAEERAFELDAVAAAVRSSSPWTISTAARASIPPPTPTARDDAPMPDSPSFDLSLSLVSDTSSSFTSTSETPTPPPSRRRPSPAAAASVWGGASEVEEELVGAVGRGSLLQDVSSGRLRGSSGTHCGRTWTAAYAEDAVALCGVAWKEVERRL
ncbi:hypothetical protein DFH09DRAFT_1281703 [Mycena vulgaris]|nr:hypothetical protein DFH09DRAFT_1281703 [Mycena vulgaris]